MENEGPEIKSKQASKRDRTLPAGMAKGLASKEVGVVGNGGCSKMFVGDVGSCVEGCGDWSGLINYKGRKSLVAFIYGITGYGVSRPGIQN